MAGMSEAQHQIAVINWSRQPHVRQRWPELKLLYHIVNEGQRSVVNGANLKRMGLKRGVPDLHLPVARGPYHSLYIEMKTENGKTSAEQDWWTEQLNIRGNLTVVCFGWEEAVSVLEDYLSEK